MARGTRVDEVTEFILEAIASGRFPIGERLPGEEALAVLADASRLTLREAVSALAAQRVLDPVQGRGTFVNDPSQWLSVDALLRVQRDGLTDTLLHLVEVRGFLEIGAAERFARVASEAQLSELARQLDRMVAADAAGDYEQVTEADLAFHRVIIEGSGNPFIAVAMAPLAGALTESRRATSNVSAMREHAISEHSKVLLALRAHDAAAARKAMRSHMRQTADDIRRFFGSAGS